ncbi:MAG: glycine cleavage system protein GcvH [Gemmatimonadales bacterium]|nr:glycine cleavage system protein GcvH [Gemmatimonadales bacterium]HQW67326.1 glycine cleavage system protein GcvH [Gemmatimonadales bacterium]
MEYPDNLKYSVEHEWLATDGTVGITAFAVEQIGDIVFVELPAVGSEVVATKPFGVIESVKAVSELFAPVSGKVIAVNTSLGDAPETVASDCYGAGWLIKIEPSKPDELLALRDSAAYQAMIAAS